MAPSTAQSWTITTLCASCKAPGTILPAGAERNAKHIDSGILFQRIAAENPCAIRGLHGGVSGIKSLQVFGAPRLSWVWERCGEFAAAGENSDLRGLVRCHPAPVKFLALSESTYSEGQGGMWAEWGWKKGAHRCVSSMQVSFFIVSGKHVCPKNIVSIDTSSIFGAVLLSSSCTVVIALYDSIQI